jgi:cytochrome c biogenesis protein CcmG/thiol:disulfide interchange protein DsbE
MTRAASRISAVLLVGADGCLRLSELRGIPVVLNLWASWCTPCAEEAPVLERGGGEPGDQGCSSSASTCRTYASSSAPSASPIPPYASRRGRRAIRYGATGIRRPTS